MRHRRDYLVLLAMVSFMLFLPAASQAAPKITIRPVVSGTFRADSNYFRTDGQNVNKLLAGTAGRERRVFTYLLQPGINFAAEWANTEVLLNYTLDINRFDDQEDLVLPRERSADDDDYYGHTGNFTLRHKPTRRLMIGLDDVFYRTRDPAQSDELNNVGDRDLYWVNRITPLLFYDFGPKFTAGLRYRSSLLDYDPADREDSDENRATFDFIYHLQRDLYLDFEYQYWKKNYDGPTSDYDSHQVRLILSKEFRIVKLGAGVGYQKRNFDEPVFGEDNLDTPTYFVTIGLKEVVLAGRYFEFIDFNITQNFNDEGQGNTYYVANRFSLDLEHAFTKKLFGTLKTMYQISNYQTFFGTTPEGNLERRDDNTWELALGIRYSFAEWLDFYASAGREQRDSNIAGRDYTNDYVIARISFGYELGGNR